MGAELFSVRSHDPSAFLSPVLQRVEAVVREFGGIGMPINTENTAIMFGILLHFTRSTGAHYSIKASELPVCPRNILRLKKPPEKGRKHRLIHQFCNGIPPKIVQFRHQPIEGSLSGLDRKR